MQLKQTIKVSLMLCPDNDLFIFVHKCLLIEESIFGEKKYGAAIGKRPKINQLIN